MMMESGLSDALTMLRAAPTTTHTHTMSSHRNAAGGHVRGHRLVEVVDDTIRDDEQNGVVLPSIP